MKKRYSMKKDLERAMLFLAILGFDTLVIYAFLEALCK